MSRFDVVIIGAGAAGLAAGRALSGAGKRVCLLEARDRTGGRVHSLHLPPLPLPIELGAEFIHGESETTFGIVDAAGLTAMRLPDTHCWSRDGKWESVDEFWELIDDVRRKIGARKRDLTFAEFLRTHKGIPPRTRQLACNFVEGYHAADADRMSTLALRMADSEQEEDGGANKQFRLAGGQDELLRYLLAGLDPERSEVRLNTVATRIAWSPGNVTIECRTRNVVDRIRATAVILTIPIGVWKAPRDQEGAIAFDPPLREKENVLAKLEAGHVVKIAFRFRERWWRDVNFLHSDDRYMPTWWTMAPARAPILIGWAGGPAADAMLAEGKDAMIDRALDAMSRAWCEPREKIESLLAGTYTHDWQSDPFSRCAYSYAGVGGSGAADELAKPLRGTLFFAGEATSSDETGTVAGAIESGRRAAREVLRRRG